MQNYITKAKELIIEHQNKLLLIIAFLLVGILSFELGVLQGQKWQQKPLLIEKRADTPAASEIINNGNFKTPEGLVEGQKADTETKSSTCAFVGSKNSDKFYAPTCQWATRIKPENKVCYKSEQEALQKGKTKSDCK